MQLTRFILLAALSNLCAAAYNLLDDYNPSNFFDKFNFFSVSANDEPLCLS